MLDEYRVHTPEVVDIAYDIAGIGTRFVAAAVDALILGIAIVVIILGAIGLSRLPEPAPTAAVILAITLVMLAYVFSGYYILFETLWSGQTPGKRLVRIRVIKTSGYPIGFVDAAVRNLLRVVDMLPAFYGLGLVTMFVNRQSRRLGDLAAGTLVVKERPRVSARDLGGTEDAPIPPRTVPVPGSEDRDELEWDLRALTPRDLQIMGEYLDRASGFAPEVQRRIGEEVAAMVAGRIGARTPLDPIPFLQRVLDLYQAPL